MQANTKQVRTLAKASNINYGHTYTDKTTAKHAQRRSVVFCLRTAQQADALATYLRNTIANKVTRTGVASNFATRTHGGQYVRVIADLA